jgi:hypothetical protein
MTDNYKQEIYVCPECGSEDVLEPTWVYANGKIIGDRVESFDFDLCEACGAQMSIIPKRILREGETNDR